MSSSKIQTSNKMVRFLIAVAAISMIGASCNKPTEVDNHNYSDGQINIAGKSISFELAESPEAQAKGLSGRESIEENQGMLFLFPAPIFLSFWMKDMNFPIDIIWLKGPEVVDITAGVQPEPGVVLDQLKIYGPKVPADRALEVKAGWASRNELKIGDQIEVIRTIKP